MTNYLVAWDRILCSMFQTVRDMQDTALWRVIQKMTEDCPRAVSRLPKNQTISVFVRSYSETKNVQRGRLLERLSMIELWNLIRLILKILSIQYYIYFLLSSEFLGMIRGSPQSHDRAMSDSDQVDDVD